MKLKFSCVTLWLVLFLATPLSLKAFYDPGLQRWINRDPIGEVGGLNLFVLTVNEPPNAIDTDGLGTIQINVTCDNSTDKESCNKAYQKQLDDLRARMASCCTDFKIGCDVKVTTSMNGDTTSKPIGGYTKCPFKKPFNNEIPVIVTSSPLEKGKNAIGRTWEGWGVIITPAPDDPQTLSHELGHAAGYKGDAKGDPSHSSKKENLMHKDAKPNTKADKSWCEKVAGLAK